MVDGLPGKLSFPLPTNRLALDSEPHLTFGSARELAPSTEEEIHGQEFGSIVVMRSLLARPVYLIETQHDGDLLDTVEVEVDSPFLSTMKAIDTITTFGSLFSAFPRFSPLDPLPRFCSCLFVGYWVA